MEKKNKTFKSKKTKRPKQISIFLILVLLVITLIIIVGCIIANCIVQTIRYKTYTDQMYYYGYNELYGNKKATAYQKVSNIDMLKVILGTVNDTTDVTRFTLQKPTEEITEDDLWYEAAKDIGLTKNLSQKQLNKKATIIDAVTTIIKTLEWSLGIEIEQAKLQISDKLLRDFSDDDKANIAKAVTLGIIDNENASIKNTKLIKGELNKLVIELANKYATMHYDTVKLDENGFVIKNDIHIITDKDKLPKTASKYPYVVDSIEKEIYEADLKIENEENFKSPKEVYKERSYLYTQIDETISRYFNNILNVNYKTIDETLFSYNLSMDSVYKIEEGNVKKYVNHVKENNIILKGSAEPLLPIIYNTGERYVVRTKITFEVKNSKTEYNLLFGDENSKVKYTGKAITMYVDVPMGLTLNSNTLLVDVNCNALFSVLKNENVQVGGK